MVDKKKSAIIARRQARERLTQERAEQDARNRANESDLTEFLILEQRINAADANRDAALKAAQQRHQREVDDLKHRQSVCLARMNRRGETTAVISDRTGLTNREVRHLISHAPADEAGEP